VRGAWRQACRRPWRSTALLLLALAALALPFLGSGAPAPTNPQPTVEDRLAAGEEVQLIGPTGPPASYRFADGTATVMDWSDGGPSFTVASVGFCRMELVANPRRAHYRFSAEVKHGEGTTPNSCVGIYCLASRHVTSQGVDHCCCLYTFDDHTPLVKPPGGPDPSRVASFVLWRHQVPLHRSVGDLKLHAQYPPAPPGPLPWRKLVVEVSPAEVRVSWGETPKQLALVGSPSRPGLVDEFQQWKKTAPRIPGFHNPEVNPEFRPESGLGLYVSGGRGYFRNVIVTPLD
jgi:hypothetical protein